MTNETKYAELRAAAEQASNHRESDLALHDLIEGLSAAALIAILDELDAQRNMLVLQRQIIDAKTEQIARGEMALAAMKALAAQSAPAPSDIPTWKTRMVSHYSGGGVSALPGSNFMQDEINDLRAALSRASAPVAPSFDTASITSVIALDDDKLKVIFKSKKACEKFTSQMYALILEQAPGAAPAAPAVPTTPVAPSEPTRLDVMSLIHSQVHRAYIAGHEGEEVAPKYAREIEDAIMGIYHGRYIAGYDLRKSEEAAPSAPAPARTNDGEPTGPQWKPITGPGQVKVGTKLRFNIGDTKRSETAKQILHAGTEKEEIIYNKSRNFYLITSMAAQNRGSQKNAEYLPDGAVERHLGSAQ